MSESALAMPLASRPKVIGLRPIETGTLYDQHPLLFEQLEHKSLIVDNRIDLRIESREHIQRRFRLDAGDARNIGQQLVSQVALLQQAPARPHQVLWCVSQFLSRPSVETIVIC